MQIADFLLSDGGKRVDRVEPGVEGGRLRQLLEAFVLELNWVLDAVDGANKAGSLRQDVGVGVTEVFNVVAEVGLELNAVGALSIIREGTQLT